MSSPSPRLPVWGRVLIGTPALIVIFNLLVALAYEPSPAHQGSFEPCPPKAPPGELELGVRHPGKVTHFMDRFDPCEVVYLYSSVRACSDYTKATRSDMDQGCVIPKPYGYLLQDRRGQHYKVDFDLIRIDPMPWGERLVRRASDQPLIAIILVLVVIGAIGIIARNIRRRAVLVWYGLFAGTTSWLVYPFASLL